MNKGTDRETLLERVKRLYTESLRELRWIGIRPSSKIKKIIINDRAKKRLGCCKKERALGGGTFTIEISSLCSEIGDRQLKEIIIHELLHTCPGCLNHGTKWKALAEKVTEKLGYDITTTAKFKDLGLAETTPEYRYVLICKKCGHKIPRARKSKAVKKPWLYRCNKCGGRLRVEEL